MPFIFIIIVAFIFGLTVINILRQVINNVKVISKKPTNFHNTTNLEHKNCDNSYNASCLHIDNVAMDNRYGKVCKKCGHRNEQSAKKCSVCSTKLR